MQAGKVFATAAKAYAAKRVKLMTLAKWNVLSPIALPIRGALSRTRLNKAVAAFEAIKIDDKASYKAAKSTMDAIGAVDPKAHMNIMSRLPFSPEIGIKAKDMKEATSLIGGVSGGDSVEHGFFERGKPMGGEATTLDKKDS